MKQRIALLLLVLLLVGVFVLFFMPEMRGWPVSWEEFQTAAGGTTCIRIFRNGLFGRDRDSNATSNAICEETDPEAIGEFLENMSIFKGSSSSCECPGDLMFEFLKDDEILVRMSLHHGKSFRWNKSRLRGDAHLTKRTRDFVMKWLADRDVHPADIVK